MFTVFRYLRLLTLALIGTLGIYWTFLRIRLM